MHQWRAVDLRDCERAGMAISRKGRPLLISHFLPKDCPARNYFQVSRVRDRQEPTPPPALAALTLNSPPCDLSPASRLEAGEKDHKLHAWWAGNANTRSRCRPGHVHIVPLFTGLPTSCASTSTTCNAASAVECSQPCPTIPARKIPILISFRAKLLGSRRRCGRTCFSDGPVC